MIVIKPRIQEPQRRSGINTHLDANLALKRPKKTPRVCSCDTQSPGLPSSSFL